MHKKLGIVIQLVASLSLVSLAGCSITGFGPDVDSTITQSIVIHDATNDLQETVDPSDWDKVRTIMATALFSQPAGESLPWQNDITGTAGSIIPMDVKPDGNGRFCRTFSTTLNGIGGVSQYRGDACKKDNGEIELVDLIPYNAVVEVHTPQSGKKIQ